MTDDPEGGVPPAVVARVTELRTLITTYDGQYSALPAFTEVVFTSAVGLNVNNVSGDASTGTVQTIFKNEFVVQTKGFGVRMARTSALLRATRSFSVPFCPTWSESP